jgi:5-methylcytosine-specific restriction endonuclease McrA
MSSFMLSRIGKAGAQLRPCPKCGVECALNLRPDTPHHGEIRCPDHGHFWIPRPAEEKKKKRKVNSALTATLPKGRQHFCWACLRERPVLAALRPSIGLEVHHIIEVADGGSDDLENLMLLCSECHAEVHRRREAFSRYQDVLQDGQL